MRQLITKSQTMECKNTRFQAHRGCETASAFVAGKGGSDGNAAVGSAGRAAMLQGEHLTALTVPATDQVTHLLTLTCLWLSCFIMLCHFIVCHFISCHMCHVPNVVPKLCHRASTGMCHNMPVVLSCLQQPCPCANLHSTPPLSGACRVSDICM